MSLAAEGSDQEEHGGADGCGHDEPHAGVGDPGAIQTAVRGGQQHYDVAKLISMQVDIINYGLDNHQAGAGDVQDCQAAQAGGGLNDLLAVGGEHGQADLLEAGDRPADHLEARGGQTDDGCGLRDELTECLPDINSCNM